MTRTIKYWVGPDGEWYDLTEEQYGASHYNFTPPTITVGVSLDIVELEVVSSGVKVVALEYKTVKLRVGKMLHDRLEDIKFDRE
jgi:hypothetical protein